MQDFTEIHHRIYDYWVTGFPRLMAMKGRRRKGGEGEGKGRREGGGEERGGQERGVREKGEMS